MGIANVRANVTYQQYLRRAWTRRTAVDFYQPIFAHLGEQAVFNREVMYDPTGDTGGVFGYQERWAEYRYGQSTVTGKFRSRATGTLDAWHLALDYDACPALNADYLMDVPPVSRVIAVDNEPEFRMDMDIQARFTRVMPLYSDPGLMRL